MATDSDNNKNDPKSPSRLSKHLQLMGMEDHGISDRDLTAEREGMDSMNPPPLNLGGLGNLERLRPPGVRSPRRAAGPRYGVGLLAVAAAAAFMLFINKEVDEADPGYRVKGAPEVTVHTEHAGVVTTWDKRTVLVEGTRIRVEFKAFQDMVAFIGVRNGSGEDLFPAANVWTQRMTIDAGAVAVSPGSIELTGEGEGEVLIAVSCPKSSAPEDAEQFADAWRHLEALGKRCAVEVLRLR